MANRANQLGNTGEPPLIELQDVSKVYRTGDYELYALRAVSLRIFPGEYVAIIGASGSGKSTLMNIIGLLDQPTQGQYRLRGEEVGRLASRRLARLRNREIGFVFQNFHLLPRVSARRQVELPLVYAGVSPLRSRQIALTMLNQVGLGARAHHRPEELSGGQKQRVAIARALVNQPSLLLADEPTGALDSQTSEEILQLCEKLRQEHKLTILLVTHDMNVAQRTERIVTVRDGAIVEDRVKA
ncbi:MAG: ABC transporter ATP-binding protein [Caldilineaceae bacterium]